MGGKGRFSAGRGFFVSPPVSSESYCFIIHAMGANRPLAGRLSVAVLTVHGTLRAAGSGLPHPPHSHPRSGRRMPGSPVPAQSEPTTNRSDRRGRRSREAAGSEQACSLPRLLAPQVFAAPGVESNARSSHSLQTKPRLGLRLPQANVSGFLHEARGGRGSERRGVGGQQQAGLNSDSAQAAGEPVHAAPE